MRKASLLLTILFVGGLAFSGTPSLYTGASHSKALNAQDQCQMELKGVTIPTSSYVDVYINNAASWTKADFFVTSVSSGNITTASLTPIYSSGETVSASVTMTSGTPITSWKSMFNRMRIYSNIAAPVMATINILVTR